MNNTKLNRISIGALCALYLAFRLWRLTDSCLWFDEIFGIHAADHGWNSLFWFVAQDLIHPPLFYVLLKFWIGIGGESVLWVRLFSVVFSAAAVVPFLYLCKEIKLKRAAVLLAFTFFVVNGSLIKYAQEVRMYSLLLCLSLFSIWLFSRFFYRGKNIWILTIVNILLVHTHYFGWLIVLGEVAVIAILQRIKIRHVLIMLAIDIAAFVPWAFAIVKAAKGGSSVSENIGWIARPGIRSMFDLAFDVIEPFYFQASNAEPSTIILITLPLLAIIASAGLIYLIEWRRHNEHERFWMLMMITLVPIAIAFSVSWIFSVSVWGSRHLIVVYAPIMILNAVFLTEISNRVIRYALIAAVLLLTASGGYRYSAEKPDPQIWCVWEKLARDIPAEAPQTIYAFEDLVAYHLWFATRDNANIRIVKVGGVQGMVEDKAYFLPRGFDGVRRIEQTEIAGERFWIAFRDMKWNEKHLPMSFLTERGYTIGNPHSITVGGMSAFAVEITKK